MTQCWLQSLPWGKEAFHCPFASTVETVGRYRQPRSRAGIVIDTHLAVGRWRLRGGHPDPLCGGNGGLFRGTLVVHLVVLSLLSAAATEVLSQAADAQDGQDDQEDDDKDPGVRNHQHHPDSSGYPHGASLPPLTHTHPQGRKPSPVLCGPGPSEGCAQRS